MFFKLMIASILSFCLCASKEDKFSNPIPLEKIRQTKSKNPRKILIVSFGKIGGHVSLTKALSAFLKQNCEIDILNTEDLHREKSTDYYQILQKSISIIALAQTFHHMFHNLCSKLPGAGLNFFYKLDEFRAELVKNKYDLVIFTSPIHLNEINRECMRQKIPCINLIADYGEPEMAPSFWIREECMAYLLPRDSYFKSTIKHSSLVYLSGMPIRPEFKIIREKSKQEVKIKLGLDPKVPCIVVFFGAGGSDEMFDIAQACKGDKSKCFMFLCGLNDGVKNRIEKMNCSHFRVVEYVNNPAEYIRAADVLVGKLGGLSTTEAIACETPCISKNDFLSTLPAEKPNLRYVEENGYGKSIASYDELLPALDEVINKTIVFPRNNGLEESVSVIRSMLRAKGKWVKRFYYNNKKIK